MDWDLAIKRNSEALKGIIEVLSCSDLQETSG